MSELSLMKWKHLETFKISEQSHLGFSDLFQPKKYFVIQGASWRYGAACLSP